MLSITMEQSASVFNVHADADLATIKRNKKQFFKNRSKLSTEKYKVVDGFLIVKITITEPMIGSSKHRFVVYMYGQFVNQDEHSLMCVSSGSSVKSCDDCEALIGKIKEKQTYHYGI